MTRFRNRPSVGVPRRLASSLLGRQNLGPSIPPLYDPSILSPDVWLEARFGVYSDAGVTPAEESDLVYRIADELSGNTNNYDQVTSGKRATLEYENGKPYIASPGGNFFYDRGSDITFIGDFFYSAVVKATGDAFPMINRSGGGQHRVNRSGVPNIYSCLVSGTEGISGTYTNTAAWTITTVRRIGSTVTFFEGVTPRGSFTESLNHVTGGLFFGWSASLGVNGGIAATLLGRTLDDENLAGLVSYLTTLKP